MKKSEFNAINMLYAFIYKGLSWSFELLLPPVVFVGGQREKNQKSSSRHFRSHAEKP